MTELLPLVDVRQGTRSDERRSHGNCLPLTQLPFGMAPFTLQTDGAREPWFFHPDSAGLEGIRLTHMPCPWIRDYGTFLFLPQTGQPQNDRDRRCSPYVPDETVLSPAHMDVPFFRSAARVQLAPTARGCVCRFSFADLADGGFISFLSTTEQIRLRYDADSGCLFGCTEAQGDPGIDLLRTYFVARFSADAIDPARTLVWRGFENEHGAHASGRQAAIHLAVRQPEVTMQLAISYISHAQALQELDRQCGDYPAALSSARQAWEDALHLVEAETDTPEERRTLYSCLYRCFLFPHMAYETDAAGRDIHFVPSTGAVAPGRRYTDTGLWDTARTQLPLLSILMPQRYADIVDCFIREYEESGWLPRWLSMGEIGCMPSTFIDTVLADAAAKGLLTGERLRTALDAMRKHAEHAAPEARFGRNGVEDYLRLGYVPAERPGHSVSLTLDAAYGDFCIAEVAARAGDRETERRYRERAQNYRRLFDPATGFMRARHADGRFVGDAPEDEPFDPAAFGGPYCETNAWQTTFAVPHDPAGLFELFGGQDALCDKLDALFSCPPTLAVGGYDRVIHEMTELYTLGLGQCLINDQPGFLLPYWYAAAGQPEKTDRWLSRICRTLFSAQEDGFPGDEDNGSLAAWYVFAVLGFFPFCPGSAVYLRTAPLVRDIRLRGRAFSPADQPQWFPHSVLTE